MRRELGRQLAARRQAAGYAQRELGALAGYSRTAIANAETGGSRVGRQLWEHADRVLVTGELFARGYDRIQAHRVGESRATVRRRPSTAPGEPGESGESAWVPDGMSSVSSKEARRAYAERGWPVKDGADRRLWLVTGTAIDALEVPRPAGMVAMNWWLFTRGVPDEIRGLPALPDPAVALAVITAGTACYFLTRSRACPWTGHDGPADRVGSGSPVTVRWHAEGGHVPAPPSELAEGQRATWIHAPPSPGQLASPMALLHLLAQAVAATQQGAGLGLLWESPPACQQGDREPVRGAGTALPACPAPRPPTGRGRGLPGRAEAGEAPGEPVHRWHLANGEPDGEDAQQGRWLAGAGAVVRRRRRPRGLVSVGWPEGPRP
jgi:transcriptional regulator with XRE-family HTH domain